MVKPDIVTGFRGEKIAIYVLNRKQYMHDTGLPDGRTAHFIGLNSEGQNVRNVVLPLESVVDYDLAAFKLALKPGFSLADTLYPKVNTSATRKMGQFATLLAQKSQQQIASGATDHHFDQFAQ